MDPPVSALIFYPFLSRVADRRILMDFFIKNKVFALKSRKKSYFA
jgi:hypothetical protein